MSYHIALPCLRARPSESRRAPRGVRCWLPSVRAGSVLALVLPLALMPATALAQPAAPLTLADALKIATARSAQITAAEAAARGASSAALAAGELPDPVLKFGVDNLPIDGPDRFSTARDGMTMRRIGVMQEMPLAEKRRLRRERMEADAVREQLGGAVARAALQRDTALAWLDRLFADRQIETLGDQRAELDLAIAAADAAYRSNRGARFDIVAAQAARAQLDDRVAQLERQRAGAVIQLSRWIGDAAQRPAGPAPDWLVTPPHADHLEASIEDHPDLALAARQEAIAALDLKLAEAATRPDWSWELTYQQRGSSYPSMISFGVSIPLPVAQASRQDREIAAKRAAQDQARALRDDLRRAHLAEARALATEWDSLRDRLRRYDTTLIPLARERAAATLDAYRAGAAMLAQVLEARRNEIDVRLMRLDLERDCARAWAQLAYLIPDKSERESSLEQP